MWDQQPEKNASFSVKQKHGNKRERMKMKSKVLMYSLRNYNGKDTQRAESIHWKKNLNTKEDKCHVSLLTISVLSHFWARHVNYPEIPSIGRYIQASICISPLRFSKYGCILQPPGKQRAGSEASLRLIFSLANLTFTAEFPLLWWCYKHLLGLNCHEWGSTVLQIQRV